MLGLSAIVVAPWSSLSAPEFIIPAIGAGGLVYTGIVTRRATRQQGYQLVAEDWVWHVSFPFLAYADLVAVASIFDRDSTVALYLIAGTALLLLFTGIHNAWDTVTFVTVTDAQSKAGKKTGA